MTFDERYMRRALQLAALGAGHVSPNPMVGAVIVGPDGDIIGEGWHRQWGQGHAEVNAVASVRRPELLEESTMYVTLEPCSHWGKTPPCARLIIERGIPRVVVGATDPFPAVSGRGIAMLREAGVEVVSGVLAEESRRLNARFITAHTQHRPFVLLKWAQSADGYMDRRREPGQGAARLSSPLTSLLMHRLRSMMDGILVGSGTALADDPHLDARLWPGGRSPRPVLLDRRQRVPASARLMQRDPIVVNADMPMADMLHMLYEEYGLTSLMVEGGSRVLASFMNSGLWDAARVEVAPEIFGAEGTAPAPAPGREPMACRMVDSRNIFYYSNNPLVEKSSLLTYGEEER
ncbi:MAG: bifunctional diaminohydroxyphosphoribosylaminopyrimidine deaminase/5-amino-6-(5-phosphoribosylamino)uracil reductase RibD [Muribaculaceae bacterium]|nr:bifunctional diaminohydroxyphosphoribosylaminopyrimidine deaminase/5-amino-6-(5-phosphoribosylamino)uracil reductase RibD [Muribaculaceae bacterium]